MKNTQARLLSLVALSLIFGAPQAMASEANQVGIGFYTAVSGQVSVMHPRDARVLPVKLNDEVRFKDVIETLDESRTKAFFLDESILTIGEKSRVEIDEYIYNPEHSVRRAIVKLVQGQVRALVSRVFKANGSKFEIHTPSAVAAARGTYFTVWVENGQSGIINIGEKGRVDFTSGGVTVAVDPGYFSVAREGQAPSMPMAHALGQTGNGQSASTVKGTEKNTLKHVTTQDRGLNAQHAREKAELIKTSAPAGLEQALAAVERTLLRETPLTLSLVEGLEAMNHENLLVTAMKSVLALSAESGSGSTTGTASGVTGGTIVGTVTTGAVATAVTAPTVSVGSVSVAPVAPVIAPVAPIINLVTSTPPAVINGTLNLP